MNTVCPVSRQPCSQKNLKKLEKQIKKSEGREKIQNEHCLSGQQTNVFAKTLKKLEKQIKRERGEKIQNEHCLPW